MRRISEKVVTVAYICITLLFVVLTALYITNIVPIEEYIENQVVMILLGVLAVLYVIFSIYLLHVNFSEKVNVKRILLYYDSESETRASTKVVDNIVSGCAKQVKELKVQKVKIRMDDKLGLIATIYVKASADNMSDAISRLRALLAENFKATLGITFNAINFEISKLTKKFVPESAKNAKKKGKGQVAEEVTEEVESAEDELVTPVNPYE